MQEIAVIVRQSGIARDAFDERDETNIEKPFGFDALRTPGDAQKLLAVLVRIHRDDHDAAGSQLLQKGFGQDLRRSSDDDALEGGLGGPALEAIAQHGGDIGEAELFEPPDRGSQQGAMALDGIDAPADQRENCGLVARTGTDLEHLHAL